MQTSEYNIFCSIPLDFDVETSLNLDICFLLEI